MVRTKPHVVNHYPVATTSTGGRADVPTDGTGRAVRCQITPMSADAALRTFSGDLRLSQPHLMLCDVDTYNRTIKSGDKVVWQGLEYYVNAAPMVWEAGISTDCIQILLEKEEHQ